MNAHRRTDAIAKHPQRVNAARSAIAPYLLAMIASLALASMASAKLFDWSGGQEGTGTSWNVSANWVASTNADTSTWKWAGWGGGGFYYAAVYHPLTNGTLYLGGDVAGVYKSTDHGLNWKMINTGLVNYGVFSLAVDRTAPDTVYAATAGGLCVSTNGGVLWRLLPSTAAAGLRITGEKGKSTRSVAVDPSNGSILYASSPNGILYKSLNRGETWQASYSNLAVNAGSIYTVAVADLDPTLVFAATQRHGIIRSTNAGTTWTEAPAYSNATSVAVAPSDPNVVYATFSGNRFWKSIDGGQTWQNLSSTFTSDWSLHDVAISPSNPLDVYVLANNSSWGGRVYRSADGGVNWSYTSQMWPNRTDDPVIPEDYTTTTAISWIRNIAINPFDGNELYVAQNCRPMHSADKGATFHERVRGADITCIYDVRFHKGKVYSSAMDSGAFVSEDNGTTWKSLWPRRWNKEYSGHYWRLNISTNANGATHIVSTCSPWDAVPNRVVLSPDGGTNVSRTVSGLPATMPWSNTMWGTGYARALESDPANPNILYLGIDGDPSTSCPTGGGIFKSVDHGSTWTQLAAQPGSRRMFFGLAVDPTNSQRIFWGACGTNGGLWRSENGGASWTKVFSADQWIFNVHVAADGTVYCPGKQLWRSTNHGTTWQQITSFPAGSPLTVIGIATDPANPARMWFTATTWDGSYNGGVYETVDNGVTWLDITDDLAYRKPLVLRYNPETRELWAAGVGLFRCRK